MKSSAKFIIVLVTAPSLRDARKLAQTALRAKLIACANLIPKIESHYRWRGKIEKGHEVLLIMKTAKACLPALENLVREIHPYDTPEFLILPLAGGSKKYLAWITESCALNR